MRKKVAELYELPDVAVDALGLAFDAWAEEVEFLVKAEAEGGDSDARMEDALAAGRAQWALLEKILQAPGMSEEARTRVLDEDQWVMPRR